MNSTMDYNTVHWSCRVIFEEKKSKKLALQEACGINEMF